MKEADLSLFRESGDHVIEMLQRRCRMTYRAQEVC